MKRLRLFYIVILATEFSTDFKSSSVLVHLFL